MKKITCFTKKIKQNFTIYVVGENNKMLPKYLKPSALSIVISTIFTLPHQITIANEALINTSEIEQITVTGSRRLSTVQSLPINIGALNSDVIEHFHLDDLVDVARWLPGLTIADQGGYYQSPIIVRGLNTNASNPSSDAGTVATYLDDIPLAIDLKLIDVERVEALIGPQGTLYGAGTLGGAIRYITKKPVLNESTGELYAQLITIKESDDIGHEVGFVFNQPIINNKFALRAAVNYLNNPGFIDNRYLLQEPGVSLPDPDITNSQAVSDNFITQNDINTEEVLTTKLLLRYQPSDKINVNFAYHYQKEEYGGRSLSHFQSLSVDNPIADEIGRYDSAYRYLEPRKNKTSLLSLEVFADLGFAELTSATGVSDYDSTFQRDQTDLLIDLDLGYEEFPAFSAFARDTEESKNISQEIRLVSNTDSIFSWILGGFYSNAEFDSESLEFAPNFDEFAVENFGAIQLRPDDLEFVGIDRNKIIEKAIFGELSIALTKKLSATLGARFYKNTINFSGGTALPLFETLFIGTPANETNLFSTITTSSDTGNLFKFNLHYQFNSTALSYLTISEGFRLGGNNGLPLCDENISTQCALPSEFDFTPDTTLNYELGYKSTWYKNKLHFNAALFLIKWRDAQVESATVNGALPFISNAGEAESKGIELSSRIVINNNFSANINATYTDARLTQDAPFLYGDQSNSEIQPFFDGEKGDRLPGSPQQQLSASITYETQVFNNQSLSINYGFFYQGNVYTTVGLKANGEELPSYALNNLSMKLYNDSWQLSLNVDNIFNRYATTGVRDNLSSIGLARDEESNGNRNDIQRRYARYLVTPRTLSLQIKYNFGH